MEKTDRIQYIDIAKGIGIICVIIGHMGWSLVDRIIYPFHMPLFFLLSGCLISDKYKFIQYMVLKFKKILFPYFETCIVGCFLAVLANFLLSKIGEERTGLLRQWIFASMYGSCRDYSEPFIIVGVGPIWFLWALFWALILVYYVRMKKNGYVIIIVFASISFVSSQYIWLPFSIQAGGVAAAFVYIGYCWGRKGILGSWNKRMVWLGLLVWIIEIVCEVRLDISGNIFDLYGLSAVGAIFICYFILFLSDRLIKNKIIVTSLEFLGQNSLLILCLHSLEVKFFPWSLVYSVFGLSGFTALVVIFILRIVFCVSCVFVLKRIRKFMGFC